MSPEDGRFLNRLPAPRPAPDFDEDTPPRPIVRGTADLSGNYSVNVWVWMTTGGGVAFYYAAVSYLLLLVVLIAAVTAALYATAIPLLARMVGRPAAEPWVNLTACVLIYLPLLVGLPHVAVRAVLGERWGPADFLTPFTRHGHVLLLGLILVLVTAVCFSPFFFARLVALYVGPDFPVALLPLAVCPFVALYFWVRWMFALPLILDQGMSALQALAASERLTRGKVLDLLGFNLLLGLTLFVGALWCGVGLLITSPLALLFHATAYLHATRQLYNDPPPASALGTFSMPPDEDDADAPPGRPPVPPVE